MKIVIFLNIILCIIMLSMGKDFLLMNSYLFFSVQAIINISFLLYKNVRFNQFLIPSLFSYIYISFNLSLGGYLTPRSYGFFKEYAFNISTVDNIHLIVFYLFTSLTILFIISINTVRKTKLFFLSDSFNHTQVKINTTDLVIFTLYVLSLILGLPFAFQLGFLLLFLPTLKNSKLFYKVLFYFLIISLSVWDYSHDKRNIFMILLLIYFFETLRINKRISLSSLKNILFITSFLGTFIFLIITASINRGYGKEVISEINISNTFSNVFLYAKSDFFIDAITDNLELNYAYGSTVTSMDYLNKGRIPFQFGMTLIKPIFLPIPRSIFENKPRNFMNLYTKEYSYQEWVNGSSLPVIFPVELYSNFHLIGLFFLYLIYLFFDSLYVKTLNRLNNNKINFKYLICSFLIITHFMLIRGSGLDLYVLYLLFGLSVYPLCNMFLNKSFKVL